MCLAIPGKLVALEGMTGIVDLSGVERKVSLQLVPEAQEGDYVLVHAGIAIQVVDEEEAQATLEIFEEYFAAQQEETEGYR